ncbi:hypothetical protein Tco_0046410 [Tanacetum coccineum]
MILHSLKQNLQSSSMTFIHKTLIIPSVLDSCFISSTVCEVKRVEDWFKLHQRLESAYDREWFWEKAIQKLAKKESMKKSFQDMLHGLGEVNPTHTYYNGSYISKDTENPSLNTSFKTRRTQKTTSALEALWKLIKF